VDEQTYKAFRAEWDRQRQDAQATVARLNDQIRDLDRAWKKLSDSRAGASNTTGTAGRNGTLASRVLAAIEAQPETFFTPNVWNAVANAHHEEYDAQSVNFRASVSNALARLVDEGVLEVVVPGAGSRPAQYRRLSNLGKEASA
jgi:hypothetical protein